MLGFPKQLLLIGSTIALFASGSLGAQADAAARRRALAQRVDEILGSTVNEDSILRRGAVERLVEIGPEAVPEIARGLQSGNGHKVRTAAIALGEIGDVTSGVALASWLGERKLGADVDAAVVGAYALGACPGESAREALLALVDREAENEHVRIAAALGLARRSDRGADAMEARIQSALRHPEREPDLFGALAVASARSKAPSFSTKAPLLLKDVREPAVRAGLWLGIAWAGLDAKTPAAAADVQSGDPVLARCALLGSFEPPRKGDSSAPELREARIVVLGMGHGEPDLAELAVLEREPSLRPAWFGAFAARGWWDRLVVPPWPERAPGEHGRFASAALVAIRGGLEPEQRATLLEQAREGWKAGGDETRGEAALLLAVLGDAGAVDLLAPDPQEPDRRQETVRIAWKFLRGELDRRRLEEAVRDLAVRARVLPDLWLSEASSRFASVLLGGGSRTFEVLGAGHYPPKLLAPHQGKRRRSLPADHAMYADLWMQLSRVPFDAMLRPKGRDDL